MTCHETVQMCCNLQPFLKIVHIVIDILQWTVPLILLVLGTIDMVKAVTSGDEKVANEVKDTFIKRLIYAALIFLVPFLIRVILNLVEDNIIKNNDDLTSPTSWVSCFNGNVNCSNCNIYDDPGDDSGNDNPGNTDDQTPTKTCYIYNKFTCNQDGASYSNGMCRYTLPKPEDYNYENESVCRQDCRGYGFSVSDIEVSNNYTSCTCIYNASEIETSSEKFPNLASDKKVLVYECESTTNCSDAKHFCKFKIETSTSQQ